MKNSILHNINYSSYYIHFKTANFLVLKALKPVCWGLFILSI
jgi:hypothetical protein